MPQIRLPLRSRARIPAVLIAGLIFGLAILWLAACTPTTPTPPPATVPSPATTATAPATAAMAAPTAAAIQTVAKQTTVPISNGITSLVWWTPDFVSPDVGGASGALMSQYIQGFEEAQGGKLRIVPTIKSKYGRGGLLDLMRSAQPVAPAVLPDIVVLDTAEVPTAAAAGLLQPLEKLLDPGLLNDMYPFARQASQVDNHTVAVPFIADIDHMVYNQSSVQTPPVTWADLLAGQATYLFPAGSPQSSSSAPEGVQRTFASQYLSAGGGINLQTRQLVLEEGALQRVFTFYGQARAAQILPANAADITSVDDCWTAYTENAVAMANISARHYLTGHDSLKDTGYAAPPGSNGPAQPVATGWALAVVTTDPVRQQAAAAWLAWLLTPDRLSAWSKAAAWLPASPQGWRAWGDNPYHTFLQSQLAAAVPAPIGFSDSTVAGQLQKAQAAVLRDGANPNDAARSVLTPAPR